MSWLRLNGRAPAAPVRASLAAYLSECAFGLGGQVRPRRLGMEVELIARVADTGEVCSLAPDATPSLCGFLRRHAAVQGWRATTSPYGTPEFLAPRLGVLSFEPGGQLEFSTLPFPTAVELLAALRAVVPPLRAAAREDGIELLCAGIDPVNPLECAPLQLQADRYARMAEYFAAVGPAGGRMMRQTAAVQLNLDVEQEAVRRWRVLNAAAPLLVAMFANSPVYAGAPTGFRSYRAETWRHVDPRRTGVFVCGADVVEEYLDFALDAPSFLLGCAGEGYLPFSDWLGRGRVGPAGWPAHLSTLFPEVRPKGYLEVRSIDALEPEWYAAPVALLAGITYDYVALREAQALLGPPDPDALAAAARAGLRDAALGRAARDLFEIGLRGCARLGPAFIGGADLEAAAAYFERFTRRGRAPADEAAALATPVDGAARAGGPASPVSEDPAPLRPPGPARPAYSRP